MTTFAKIEDILADVISLFALGMAAETFVMSFVLVIHAIIPCVFQKRFSKWVEEYNKHFNG